ncbi:MAG: alpha/beta hydrolase [Bacteroidota bacterium]
MLKFNLINFTKILSSILPYFFIFILFSCRKDEEIKPLEEFRDLSYGSKQRNQLDIYLPTKRNLNTPLLIFIHGGGWTQGDKSQVNAILKPFINKNFAVASLNYSYTDSETNYIQINEDISNAISYLISNSKNYNYSSTKVCLIGYSCGAQLGLLHAYQNNDIKAVASVSGLANLMNPQYTDTNNYINKVITYYIGSQYKNSKQLWEKNSPYLFCNKNSKPTYIINAVSDEIVSCEDAKNLRQKLDSNNIPNCYQEYSGDHNLFSNLPSSEWEKIADWFISILKT